MVGETLHNVTEQALSFNFYNYFVALKYPFLIYFYIKLKRKYNFFSPTLVGQMEVTGGPDVACGPPGE